MPDIRAELDSLIANTNQYNPEVIPESILSNIRKWKWGSYGWVSPASLLFTAAWHKYYYPEIDCCKIWAADENNNSIPGSYSIRSNDESISIPLLAKYDLCEGFCSPNSGMQGSRAIEKMRTLKRLNEDFDNAQRTIFDLKLFAKILNQTNTLEPNRLLELIKCYVVIAKSIKKERDKTNKILQVKDPSCFDILRYLYQVHDPEFTKCVVAACVTVIYKAHAFAITGVDDQKTASDARAGKPGDLTLEKQGLPIVAYEVKDKTQSIDWQNIERAKRILSLHSSLIGFVFVLENRVSATNSLICEMVQSEQLASGVGRRISIMSLFSLYQIALPLSSENELIRITSFYMSKAPAVKPETKQAWIKRISS